ncbi:uncharacterized protein Z519_12103 [Cladophialophora bantiana CBS 173.52]|uniref:Uncharacterized protein n=1 Tax=Cladophialophora bantiana (strain ATCC 10958 / CBS 173.52 / CDC B-1940 / NIH 8579) TaxID=1442370 RepID=A0A0D2EAN6_CLAB1|nr:uncharacterized protein Z519_12103 [Cladophialophora bantiana CBS 173.52]KIW87201.1 hypothetical protein Z519_12103 [Cladophialophora bantiana CBS 173.52]
MDETERVATRKSLRNSNKTLKASQFDRERAENAWDSGDDVIEVEPALPRTPRPNRVRGKSNCTTTTATATAALDNTSSEAYINGQGWISTTNLSRAEDLRSNNGATNQIIAELRTNNHQLKTNNEQLQKEMAELRAFTKDLMGELTSIKTQLGEMTRELATVTRTASSLQQLVTIAQNSTRSSASGSDNSSIRTYASVLANSVSPSSSASKHRTSSDLNQPRSPAHRVTVDTRRVRDKNKMADATEMERNIRQKIQVIPEIADIAVTGIQIRGARTRGEDWYPVKIDDVVRSAVVQEDGRTVRDDFAEAFCVANELTGVKKAFWLSKGDRIAGSMVVYLASPTEAQMILDQRTVKIGGQIAFA